MYIHISRRTFLKVVLVVLRQQEGKAGWFSRRMHRTVRLWKYFHCSTEVTRNAVHDFLQSAVTNDVSVLFIIIVHQLTVTLILMWRLGLSVYFHIASHVTTNCSVLQYEVYFAHVEHPFFFFFFNLPRLITPSKVIHSERNTNRAAWIHPVLN